MVNEVKEVILETAPHRLVEELPLPEKAYLTSDEDTEDMMLILLYREVG